MTDVNDLVLDGTKVGYYPERIAAWQRGERIAPITIDCATTRGCQARCHFCYASLQASEGERISKQDFLNFLDDAAEIGVKGVSFISDGESTLVPWYADAVEHATSVGLAVGAGSNGIKLTKPILERVLPHLSYLRFNFSAGTRKRYAEIMGVPQSEYDVVIQNIKDGMEIIRRDNLKCSLNMQMVVDPKDGDQIIPFAKLVAELAPVYGILKHCADNLEGHLGVDYDKYKLYEADFHEAEEIGKRAGVRITVKWDRLDGKRNYSRCMGPPFLLQISGNGLVSSCGFMFNEKNKKFHIGNITRNRFKAIWESDHYWDVVNYLNSENFNPQDSCGKNCLQHNTNDYLFRLVNGKTSLPILSTAPPDLAFL